jgi:hypothetical protein
MRIHMARFKASIAILKVLPRYPTLPDRRASNLLRVLCPYIAPYTYRFLSHIRMLHTSHAHGEAVKPKFANKIEIENVG